MCFEWQGGGNEVSYQQGSRSELEGERKMETALRSTFGYGQHLSQLITVHISSSCIHFK
jgi:hypothetical protein